ALGQVVVDRDQVDAVAGQRIQIERLDGDEGLALAGLHLGDVALVQDDAAHLLDVEEADAHRSLERLANRGEGLEDELVDRLAVLDPLLELDGLAGQLGVAPRLGPGLGRGPVGGRFGAWNTAWRVPRWAACSTSRLTRRPSPKRRTFSNDPSC